jgi:hypothetical protein
MICIKWQKLRQFRRSLLRGGNALYGYHVSRQVTAIEPLNAISLKFIVGIFTKSCRANVVFMKIGWVVTMLYLRSLMDCYPYFPHSLPDLVENRYENFIGILLVSVAYVLKISDQLVRKFFSGRPMSRGFPSQNEFLTMQKYNHFPTVGGNFCRSRDSR